MSAGGQERFGLAERADGLRRAERDGVDLLVIGGGITGAGVLRDAASRGLRALLVERADFASGTSSRSSKLVHGGLRYIAEGQLGTTLVACRERDLLQRLNPNLVRSVPFLFTSFDDDRLSTWKVRGALTVYSALAGFRSSSRFRMLDPGQAAHYAPDLRRQGLRGGGLYHDGQVDDARLVIETLKSAHRMGALAANHSEVIEFLHGEGGRLLGARVTDRLEGRTLTLRAEVIVNAAGPSVERVRGLDRRTFQTEMRPAKGVHLTIPRERVHAEGAVTFEAGDGRHLFLIPWDDVSIIGTTDSFTDEIDEPVVTIEEVHYLLDAANRAFPRAALNTNDIQSVFAGVRPLAASESETTPASSVSREDRLYRDPSGLISVAGGKLTTYRAMGERVVDRVVRMLPSERRASLGRSLTARLPLRDDDFDFAEFASQLEAEFDLGRREAERLIRAHGAAAETLLEEVAPALRRPIGGSNFLMAEIPWCLRNECAAGLSDLLERRVRMALFSVGQGLPELPAIAAVAAETMGWGPEQMEEEIIRYTEAVRRRYQIVATKSGRGGLSARSAA